MSRETHYRSLFPSLSPHRSLEPTAFIAPATMLLFADIFYFLTVILPVFAAWRSPTSLLSKPNRLHDKKRNSFRPWWPLWTKGLASLLKALWYIPAFLSLPPSRCKDKSDDESQESIDCTWIQAELHFKKALLRGEVRPFCPSIRHRYLQHYLSRWYSGSHSDEKTLLFCVFKSGHPIIM